MTPLARPPWSSGRCLRPVGAVLLHQTGSGPGARVCSTSDPLTERDQTGSRARYVPVLVVTVGNRHGWFYDLHELSVGLLTLT